MKAPAYTIPGAPTPTGQPAPFVGPYEWDQPNAQAAYQSALAQIAGQRQQLYHGYGVTDQGQLDVVGNPYGYMENLAQANAIGAQGAESQARQRGLGTQGLGAQGVTAAQEQGQAQTGQALDALLKGNSDLANAQSGALDTLNQRLFQDKLSEDTYAQEHNLFTTAAPQRSAAQVQNMVAAMYKAWQAAYGKGANAKNRGGVTFQQRLGQIGAPLLYDPTGAFMVGGKSFGGGP